MLAQVCNETFFCHIKIKLFFFFLKKYQETVRQRYSKIVYTDPHLWMQEEKKGECSPHFPPQHYLLKNFKQKSFKKFCSRHPCTHLLDSIINMLYLLYHMSACLLSICQFILFWDAFQSKLQASVQSIIKYPNLYISN